jgi:hypothetical protein
MGQSVTKDGLLRIRLTTARTFVRPMQASDFACYRACGMRITGEAWFPPDFDPEQPEWALFAEHLRQENGRWLERFYWMEIKAD